MSKPIFSKGPWYRIQEREHHTTTNDGHYLPKWGVYDNNQAWCIASTGSTWPTEEEEDANAALIATAPEMYELLEEIQRETYDTLDEEGNGILAIPEETLSKIVQTLAKARGEQ